MNYKFIIYVIIEIAIVTSSSFSWAETKTHILSPQGTLNYHLSVEPATLHPIASSDGAGDSVHSYSQDTLCKRSDTTGEFIPRIAKSWKVSNDGLKYTFKLKENVYFHNGELLTAEDVKFSIEAIKNPLNQGLHILPYTEGFEHVDIINKHEIVFTAKKKYYLNLNVLCSYFYIIPKSVYGDIDKSSKLHKTEVGAGPYQLEKYDKTQALVYKRFNKWYGYQDTAWKNHYNFKTIIFKISQDSTAALERLKKGELDFFELGVSDYLSLSGKPFKHSFDADRYSLYAVKNKMPKGYSYIGFNLSDPILKQKEVRLAMAYIIDREKFSKQTSEGTLQLARSPVEPGTNAEPNVKPILFSPQKALGLLKKSGWADSDHNSVLEKMIDGQIYELKINLIYANKKYEKIATVIQEEAKKIGMVLSVQYLEWNTFLKTIGGENKQMWMGGWGGDYEEDPIQVFHTVNRETGAGGSNMSRYSDLAVDKLIVEGRAELDPVKRAQIFKKVYSKVVEDMPYLFMFRNQYNLYAISKKINSPANTFNYDIGVSRWRAVEP